MGILDNNYNIKIDSAACRAIMEDIFGTGDMRDIYIENNNDNRYERVSVIMLCAYDRSSDCIGYKVCFLGLEVKMIISTDNISGVRAEQLFGTQMSCEEYVIQRIKISRDKNGNNPIYFDIIFDCNACVQFKGGYTGEYAIYHIKLSQ